MRILHALTSLTVIATSGLTVLAGSPAGAAGRPGGPPVRTVTSGLDGPYGLDVVSGTRAYVTEADAGTITSVDLRTGAQRTVLSGLPGPTGVAAHGGRIYTVLTGEGAGTPAYPPASVVVAGRDGKGARVLADLMAYELRHNPDGQRQFDDAGQPYDALSNPFSVTATTWGLLIADGGANDVLRVDPRTGKVSTFFVPPTAGHRNACSPAPRPTPVPSAATPSRPAWPRTAGTCTCPRSARSSPARRPSGSSTAAPARSCACGAGSRR
jgi:hypothetical protein